MSCRVVAWIAVLSSVAVTVFFSSNGALAEPRWSLFGEATVVRTGAGPNPLAIQLRSDAAPGFAGIDFKVAPPMTFADLFQLSTDFDVTDDDCKAGSPRFQLNMDTDSDGDFDANIFVYVGPSPSFTGCAAGWQTTGNLIGNNDTGRYDTSQIATGTQVNNYSGALAIAGTMQVIGIQLVIDSSFAFPDSEQTVVVDNVTINQHTLTARGGAP